MNAHRPFFRLSAHETDPINWFTGSLVPLVFGVMVFGYGIAFTVTHWDAGGNPLLQLVAVVLATSASVIVHLLTGALRPPIGWTGAIGTLSIAVAAFVLSAIGYSGAQIAIELWWAPFAVALTLGSLAPYLPARALLLLGTGVTVVSVPIAGIAVSSSWIEHGPVTALLIIASPLISAVVTTASFSAAVVARMLPLLEQRAQATLALDRTRGARLAAEERRRLAQLTERAVPFLQSVVDAGRVGASDRAEAGELARAIRDRLVSASRRTWLDAIATERVSVSDPERLAERLRADQRAALRGLVNTILDSAVLRQGAIASQSPPEQRGPDAAALAIELRSTRDSAVAVSLALDAEVPESRLELRLAPYYLALGGTVDGLRFEYAPRLLIAFEVPADSSG